jgi:hypothetical protein
MTELRTRLDFASTIRWLVDEIDPDAPVIRLIMDNLSVRTVQPKLTRVRGWLARS